MYTHSPDPSKQYAILRKIRGLRDQAIPGYFAPQIPWVQGCSSASCTPRNEQSLPKTERPKLTSCSGTFSFRATNKHFAATYDLCQYFFSLWYVVSKIEIWYPVDIGTLLILSPVFKYCLLCVFSIPCTVNCFRITVGAAVIIGNSCCQWFPSQWMYSIQCGKFVARGGYLWRAILMLSIYLLLNFRNLRRAIFKLSSLVQYNTEKIVRISVLANILHGFLRILSIQRIADLPNISARIVDLACNLVRIVDSDFIVELLADSNLDKTIVRSRILLQIWADRRICIPLFTPTPNK
jgi:hypothetical protein